MIFSSNNQTSIVLMSVIAILFLLSSCNSTTKKELSIDPIFAQMVADTAIFELEQNAGTMMFNYPHIPTLSIPDDWQSDTTLAKLVDLYHFCVIANTLVTDVDALWRFESPEMNQQAQFRDISTANIHNDSLRQWATELIQLTDTYVHSNHFFEETGGNEPYTDAFYDQSNKLFQKAIEKNITSNKITSQEQAFNEAEKAFSPEKWVPNCYDTFVGEDAKPTKQQINKLYTNMLQEKNFDKKVAQLFVLSGCRGLQRDTALIILREMEHAMECSKYSPLLHTLWRAYRVLYNDHFASPSTWSYNYNLRYNHYRQLVIYNYMNHLRQHPDDALAYVTLAQSIINENILRFGSYPFGNQSAAEKINLFWNKDLI